MRRPLSPEHKAAMQEGRQRARAARQVESVRRVMAYRDWLARGSPAREIPDVPSDADYSAWRASEKPRR